MALMAPVKPHKVSSKKCSDFEGDLEDDFEGIFEVLSSIVSQILCFQGAVKQSAVNSKER